MLEWVKKHHSVNNISRVNQNFLLKKYNDKSITLRLTDQVN